MTIMLVIALVLHTVETTYFYGIYNRQHGINENTIHNYYKYSIKLVSVWGLYLIKPQTETNR
jgi:hypothetical protein